LIRVEPGAIVKEHDARERTGALGSIQGGRNRKSFFKA